MLRCVHVRTLQVAGGKMSLSLLLAGPQGGLLRRPIENAGGPPLCGGAVEIFLEAGENLADFLWFAEIGDGVGQ